MAYADDITITSTHTSTSAAKKYIQPYLHKVFAWTKQNNLLLNPDKTTCTLFTPDPAEYTSNLDLTINNKALPMAMHPKVLGLTLDPKLTYSTHIHNISVQAHKPLQIIKALTATGWGKQKETLMATYKAVMRPALEYASSVWSPIASSTSINKLQVMQNAALRTATGCTQDTNIQHLHDETLTLPIHEHLQLHASQYKQKTQHPSHPLHKHTTYFNTPRQKKTTIFNNGRYTTKIPTDPHTVTTTDIKTNMRHIHTSIVSRHLATRGNNKILRTPPPHTSSSEEILPRLTLAQLRTNKSPFLKSYLHKVDAKTHPSPLCPLCNIHTHDTHHLFNCTHIRTTLSPLDLWTDPAGVTALLAGGRRSGNIGLPPLARAMGVGRQQQVGKVRNELVRGESGWNSFVEREVKCIVDWLLRIVYEESLVSDIGRACLMEVGYKSRWWARCNHVCEKFGLWELVNLLWLKNINKEGMAMLGIKYDKNVWKKTFVERIQEYGRRWSTREESTKNEKYANGSVGATVRLMVRGGCLSVRGSKGMEIRL